MTTTEQFLQYLAERARWVRTEGWFYTYENWRWIKGYRHGDWKRK